MTSADICRRGVADARQIAEHKNPRREAVGIPVDRLVDLARATVALDQVARLAADLLAARSKMLDADTFSECVLMDDALEAATEQLTAALVTLGYVTLVEEEPAHGND
ncbi:hypothetical protein V5F77_10505 [Xanthobacter sp. DSM 24535]|uniref:hypothetical protein n=1 Tax=Roseixanthobacter psychrophilus TaxID=3119917 RepID=UPI003727F560